MLWTMRLRPRNRSQQSCEVGVLAIGEERPHCPSG
jgi:hypothetical protein